MEKTSTEPSGAMCTLRQPPTLLAGCKISSAASRDHDRTRRSRVTRGGNLSVDTEKPSDENERFALPVAYALRRASSPISQLGSVSIPHTFPISVVRVTDFAPSHVTLALFSMT